MYFRQFWNDPRLKTRQTGLWKTGLDKNKIVLSGLEGTNFPIWIPDTFFVNEKTAHIHQHTVPNQFVRILDSGDVLVSKR